MHFSDLMHCHRSMTPRGRHDFLGVGHQAYNVDPIGLIVHHKRLDKLGKPKTHDVTICWLWVQYLRLVVDKNTCRYCSGSGCVNGLLHKSSCSNLRTESRIEFVIGIYFQLIIPDPQCCHWRTCWQLCSDHIYSFHA